MFLSRAEGADEVGPAESRLEVVPCNLCGASRERLLYQSKDRRLAVDDSVWNVVRCRVCGLGYVNPRPSIESIGAYYPTQYYEGRDNEQARRRYDAEFRYVPPLGGRLLDVGTASGDFVRLAAQRGFDAFGIEPSAHATPTSRVVRAHLGAAPFHSGTFDVVTAWAVFEHLHDPMSAFAECGRLLKPGGALVVQVPNLASAHGRFSRLEDVPRHLYFFSPRSLRSYGAKCGLTLEHVHHTTDIFGGGGRGTLRRWLVRLAGKTDDDFFRVLAMSREQRRQEFPVLRVPWYAVAAVERVVLADATVRAMRMSGQIVAVFRKPPSTTETDPQLGA